MPTKSKRVVYIGQIGRGETCRDRMVALQDLGFEVQPFDTTPYLQSPPRILRSLAHRFNVGPRLRRLNRDLAKLSWSGSPSRIVWVDKGRWIFPETLDRLRQRFGGPLIHFTPDSQFKLNRSRHFRRCVPLYDVLVTTKPFEVESYRDAGARRVLLTGQAYDERRVGRSRGRESLASDLCFIGHLERHYQRTLEYVARNQSKLDLKVWGPRWPRVRRPFVQGSGLWGGDYHDGIKSARIGLGLLSKRIPETSTTRSFEIPASGTLLLAERTEEHERYFEGGKEAEFFEDRAELLDKVRHYLRNDTARQRLSEAGRRRCSDSGYGNRARLRRVVDVIESSQEFMDLRFAPKTRRAIA